MNKVTLIIASVILAILGFGGCVAPREEVGSLYGFEIVELPSEAHLGDYITVKVKAPPDRDTACELILYKPVEDEDLELSFGYTIPDDQGILCWYVKLDEDYLSPGDYFIYIYDPKTNDNPFLRNIIIKE